MRREAHMLAVENDWFHEKNRTRTLRSQKNCFSARLLTQNSNKINSWNCTYPTLTIIFDGWITISVLGSSNWPPWVAHFDAWNPCPWMVQTPSNHIRRQLKPLFSWDCLTMVKPYSWFIETTNKPCLNMLKPQLVIDTISPVKLGRLRWMRHTPVSDTAHYPSSVKSLFRTAYSPIGLVKSTFW